MGNAGGVAMSSTTGREKNLYIACPALILAQETGSLLGILGNHFCILLPFPMNSCTAGERVFG